VTERRLAPRSAALRTFGKAAAEIVGPLRPDGKLTFKDPYISKDPPQLGFPKGAGLDGELLFETLEKMVKLCEAILDTNAFNVDPLRWRRKLCRVLPNKFLTQEELISRLKVE